MQSCFAQENIFLYMLGHSGILELKNHENVASNKNYTKFCEIFRLYKGLTSRRIVSI